MLKNKENMYLKTVHLKTEVTKIRSAKSYSDV